jgi:hypothetical protein
MAIMFAPMRGYWRPYCSELLADVEKIEPLDDDAWARSAGG